MSRFGIRVDDDTCYIPFMQIIKQYLQIIWQATGKKDTENWNFLYQSRDTTDNHLEINEFIRCDNYKNTYILWSVVIGKHRKIRIFYTMNKSILFCMVLRDGKWNSNEKLEEDANGAYFSI